MNAIASRGKVPPRRVALCIECPLAQHGGVEVLVRALLPGLARSMDVLLVSQDPPGGPPDSPATPDLAGHFVWDPADRAAATNTAMRHTTRDDQRTDHQRTDHVLQSMGVR